MRLIQDLEAAAGHGLGGGRGADVIEFPVPRRPLPPRRHSPPEVVALIRRPAASPLQAGRARAGEWLLELRPRSAPEIEPLMGWTASADTLQQVRLRFPSRDSAVAFARRQGWATVVREPRRRSAATGAGAGVRPFPTPTGEPVAPGAAAGRGRSG